MHQAVRGNADAVVKGGIRVAGPGSKEHQECKGVERRERPGLSNAEIESGTRGAASVASDGAVKLTLLAPFSVKVGFGLKGQRQQRFDHLVFRPLPAGFRAGGSDPLLSVFSTSIGQPAKTAKRIVGMLSKRDWVHVQALVGHVMMVVQGVNGGRDHDDLIALLQRDE